MLFDEVSLNESMMADLFSDHVYVMFWTGFIYILDSMRCFVIQKINSEMVLYIHEVYLFLSSKYFVSVSSYFFFLQTASV